MLSLTRSIISAIFVVLLVVVIKGGALGKMIAAALPFFFFALYDFRNMLTKWEFDQHLFLDALRFCWPLTLAAMLNYFFSGVDRAMLEPLGNLRQLGLYNVAVTIAGYLAVFNTTLGNTFQPDILQSIAEKKIKKTNKLIGGILLMNTVPIVLFILCAPVLVSVLTFGKYTGAVGFARILSLKNITNSLYFSMSTVLIGYGFSKITLLNKMIGTILSLGLFQILISKFGFYGAAWGQVFSFLILTFSSVLLLFFKLGRQKCHERKT
jgi:O-antigen/teichoic acid export membrane protein